MKALRGLAEAVVATFYGFTVLGAVGNGHWFLVVLLAGLPAYFLAGAVLRRRPSKETL